MWWLLTFLIGLGCGEVRNPSDPLIDSRLGLIRGLRATDGDYSMFLGIPYAKLNESNPFGPSLPYTKFEEVFEAFHDSVICPQVDVFNFSIVGSLDCLRLNIYVPNTATLKNPLPVLVWIYGGGFQMGYAGRFLYGPRFLVRHDVILVTFNYRVGPYGFMCVDIPDIPGNQGLKDQLSALRWVKNNINVFGGDANKITIFGQSAGAGSVDFLLMLEKEKLFNKVIMQSGAALCPWSIAESNISAPLQLSKHLGLDTDDIDQAISFLSGVDSKFVIGTATGLKLSFKPCVEKDFDGIERCIVDYPIHTVIPKAKLIPILTGYNSDEMLHHAYLKPEDYVKSRNVFKDILADAYNLQDDLHDAVEFVRHFYIGDEEVSENIKWQITNFMSDFLFYHPIHRSLTKYLQNGAEIVYHYIFSYVGNRNFMRRRRRDVKKGGAMHADEISYLFDISYEVDITPEDQLVIDQMTTMWTNFAKYGHPIPEKTELLPVKWLPVTKESLNYLNIDGHLSIGARPFHSRMAFWDLFVKTYKNDLKG